MKQIITTIGIDLAKNTFHVYGIDKNGKCVINKSFTRLGVVRYLSNLPACLIGLEACATSEYWARKIESLGHEVKRINPSYVKAYLLGGKNDANDAAAICEAVQRPNMRFVPHKSPEQVDIQTVHRTRQGFVRTRTALINQARGLAAEYGLIVPAGISFFRTKFKYLIDDQNNELPANTRSSLQSLYETVCFLDEKIAEQENLLKNIAKSNEAAKRLMKVPGIGFITATILLTIPGIASHFKNGRHLAAWLGLVPKQYSTGGKSRLLGISKHGDPYIRTLLVHGARAVAGSLQIGKREYEWLSNLMGRRGKKRAYVALANKTARIVWNMLAHGTEYGQVA